MLVTGCMTVIYNPTWGSYFMAVRLVITKKFVVAKGRSSFKVIRLVDLQNEL